MARGFRHRAKCVRAFRVSTQGVRSRVHSKARLLYFSCYLQEPVASDMRYPQMWCAHPVTSAAAPRGSLAPASWVGASSASSARLIVAWRVAEVIFAPNRSVM